ncbi:hypothetical protein BDV59DRAFT_193705 [Aspergillus ambiguus]|uniref:acyl-CoA thioesterase n=1 Tax=Aspergillus ambiguus TaxID=176160 RepID=UPI003CCD0C04
MDSIGGNWIPVTLCVLIIAYKNLPFMWHLRFFRTLTARLLVSPMTKEQLSPECLFLPAVHRTRSPLTECDYNIHKSNSTYFTDLDMSRGNLSLLLFRQGISYKPGPDTAVMILSGVQCVFRREIKPYQPYEIWSRVLSWDEKWLYIVSHFVERGVAHSCQCHLQANNTQGIPTQIKTLGDHLQKKIFASAVSRYVFKQGRKTFPPEKMLRACGLLPSLGTEEDNDQQELSRSIEVRRKHDLETAQLKSGWDAVHNAFDGDVTKILGMYTDLLWR